MSNKITVEVQIGMPKSKHGKAILSLSVDPVEAAQSIGTEEVTNATLEKYVSVLLKNNMTVTLVNGRAHTKAVREARRAAKAK